MALTYPSKPWVEGQKAYLLPGVRFIYSSSLRKWVPITPGYEDTNQIQRAFGVKTVEEVDRLFVDVEKLKTDMLEFGRIWKTENRPSSNLVYDNDVWIDPVTGVMVYWNGIAQTWIQVNSNN